MKSNKRLLALLFVGVLMGALDISIVGPALPSIAKQLQVDANHLSWIFSIYILFNLVGISLMARLSDKYGRRIIYIISITLFGLGSLLVSLASSLEVILIGRAIQGIGASGIFPVASAVIGDVFPPEKRGSALGLIGAVFGIAFIVGPVIAGTMLIFFDWNMLFLINIPIAIVLIWFSRRIMPSEPIAKSARIDWAGIVLMGIMLSSFTIGLQNIDQGNILISLLSMNVWPLILISLLSLGLLVLAERRAKLPVIELYFFKRRQILVVGFVALCAGFIQASFVLMPSMNVIVFGVSSSDASFMLIPLVIATALGAPVGGRLLAKTGSRAIVLAGLLFSGAGFLLYALFLQELVMIYIGGVLIGFGLAFLVGSSLRYVMLNEVPAQDRAAAQGMLTIFTSVGQMLGVVVLNGIEAASENHNQGYINAFVFLLILSLLGFIMAALMRSKKAESDMIQNMSAN